MSEQRGVPARLRINTTWPPPGRARRTILGVAGITAAAGTIMVLSAAGAGAAPTAAAPSKAGVTLCHATASIQNPYITIHVAENSINNLIFGKNGHASHVGPIFDPNGGKDQPTWGDIIPAFDWVDNGQPKHYDGLNVPAGQAILDNGCQIPEVTPSETPTESPTPTETPTETPTKTPTHSPSHSISGSSAVTSKPAHSHGVEPIAATSTAPIPAGVSAGLHTPVANAGLKAWGVVLMLLGGAFGMAAGVWPTRRRAH
jgi:hypothetical protein